MTESEKKTIPKSVKFLLGGLCGMGACVCVQPLDLVKNRMQMSGVGLATTKPSTFSVLCSVIKNEGFFSLYSGLSAGLLRQLTYSGTRLGIYTNLFEMVSERQQKAPNFFTKLSIGVVAGVCGAFVGTPSEVCLIRMTSDGRLPVAERRNYSSVLNALVRIVREEGVTTLWRGVVPTMGRSAIVNGAQLTTYSQTKEKLLQSGYFSDGIGVHLCASMISGFVTSFVSMPVDMSKTRIQNMRTIDGVPEYKNMSDVILRVVRNEGITSLWKGFTPYFLRIGPHTVLTFIFLEQANRAYMRFVLHSTEQSRGL